MVKRSYLHHADLAPRVWSDPARSEADPRVSGGTDDRVALEFPDASMRARRDGCPLNRREEIGASTDKLGVHLGVRFWGAARKPHESYSFVAPLGHQ